MDLSIEQKEIVETEYDKVIVASGAGAGKTRVITERIKYLLEKGVNPKYIYAITYTNSAAQEMMERIDDKSGEIFIGTIHSLANKILINNGVSTSGVIADEDFDELFRMIRNHSSIEIPYVEHLLVDEFQDICNVEYEFMFGTLDPTNYFVVGDSRQAIYGFKGGNYKHFLKMINSTRVKTYELSTNYRCAPEIVKYANKFLDDVYSIYRGKTTTCAKLSGAAKVEVKETSYTTLINKVLEIRKDDYKNWFILTRTNRELSDIINLLNRNNIPNTTFKKSEKTLNELKGEMVSNKVKVLTIHSAKGLEADNVIVVGARLWNEEEKKVCYVAATRAKKYLLFFTEVPKPYNYKNKFNNYNNYNKTKSMIEW